MKSNNISGYLAGDTYRIYERLGDDKINTNTSQAFLCYENAAFLCEDDDELQRINAKKDSLITQHSVKVPKTCFVVISYNNKDLMKSCLDSIDRNCNPETYSIVVLDNASTDGVIDLLKEWSGTGRELVLSENNLGFAVGCNVAASYAPEGEDIFLLNNDTQMTPNALFWLRMGLYESDKVGGVGAMQNYSYPDQRVDISFEDIEEYQKYGAEHNVPMAHPYEEKAKLNGFAMLIRRNIFDSLGGFDEQFSPGYYEDDDLSFRIRQAGYRLNVCHNSFIYHRGSQSFLTRSDLQEMFETNRNKFIAKWGFDSSEYAMMRPKEQETIASLQLEGYDGDSRFRLLYIGAGCGNAMSRIKYLYPKAEVIGIEENETAIRYAIQGLRIYPADKVTNEDIGEVDVVITNERGEKETMKKGESMEPKEYDAIVLVTPDSFMRLKGQYHYYLRYLPVRNIYVLGSAKVGELLEQYRTEIVKETDPSRLRFINEDDLIPFSTVHSVVREEMASILQGQELPRGITGWYYQQFLKLSYAYRCEDEYYLIWDGDTFPCCNFSMFSDGDNALSCPYLDVKDETHAEYFETMGVLIPGMEKVIGPSFISEHMLFKKDIVLELLNKIESNSSITGKSFWEKVIHAVGCDRIQNSSFSEYETYGTYVALRHPSEYKIRKWHSFRLGAEFFDPETITDRDYEWLGHDFTAISFEKNQTVREDHKNLFDNPAYQSKLSAKQMLKVAQEAFDDGYIETWNEDGEGTTGANTTRGEFGEQGNDVLHRIVPGIDKLKYLSDETWVEYARLGEALLDKNIDQAYLCFENAEFLCPEESKCSEIREILDELRDSGQISVRKTCFIILSYNNRYLMEQCLESIYSNCAPDSFSVVVLDNASSDGVTDWLKTLECDNFSLLLSDENLGFAGGCNEALKYADRDSDILFLNNDTRMPSNALFWLRMGLYQSDDIGATGALQNYTSDQLLDVSFDFPEQYMEFGADRNTQKYLGYRETRKLSGFAMMIRRSVIDSVGGFDIRFNPGYFEDDDLSYRIRQAGYKLLICENSFIYHVGSQGFANNPNAESVFLTNREKFKDKWGFYSDEGSENNTILKDTKLVIWDLDNTFWDGILSEGGCRPVDENIRLVKALTDKGIINSICSKNDPDPEKELLSSSEYGHIWDYFVFTSIDWTSKADRLKRIIEDMSLRPENVLFIDDELFNLKEAQNTCPGLMIATSDVIPELLSQINTLDADDPDHKRLKQYQVLETRREAKTGYESNESFLMESDIRIAITHDCTKHVDRIYEMINRTNQLNYTKSRVDMDEVKRLIDDAAVECGTVSLKDKYGDYGIIGFYALTKGGDPELIHFLFSCRVIGMGVDQYVYKKLGCPQITIKQPVVSELNTDIDIAWIKEDDQIPQNKESEIRNECGHQNTFVRPKVLLKGPCDIDGIVPYLKDRFDIELETNFVDDREIVVAGSNNSIHLFEAYHYPADIIRKVISDTPFLCEADFLTFMFDEPYDTVVFSMLSDGHSGVYVHRETGLRICFGSCNYDMTDPDNWDKYISGEYVNHGVTFTTDILKAFAEKFEFEGSLAPEMIVQNIKWMREKLPAETKLLLLLGSEIEAVNNTEEFADHADIYKRVNRALFEAFADSENIWLLNSSDYITGQDCFADCTNHFARKVYHDMADDIANCIGYAADDTGDYLDDVITMIVVNPGQEEWLSGCIDNVKRYADTELLIICNSSSALDEALSYTADGISVYNAGDSLPYGYVVNHALDELGIDKDILLLNPEFRLTSHCAKPLLEAIHSVGDVGALSGVGNGFRGGWQENIRHHDFVSAEKEFFGRDTATIKGRALALYCGALFLNMRLFRQLAGFDEQIPSEIGVILDYCLRLWKNGLKCCYTDEVFFWKVPESIVLNGEDNLIGLERKWGMHYFNINPNYNLPALIKREREEEFNVIEIGCDCGATLMEIQNRYPYAHIYGSELNPSAAGIAGCFADVSVDNIEEYSLPFEQGFFDYIIFGDVLEHLRNPQKTVEYCAKMLKPGGCIISSIPNVMHISVMEELLNGDFHYEETGLLDKTHIHLFTGKEIVRMYIQAGFEVEEMRTVILPLPEESERMIDRLMELSSPDVQRMMYQTFQYLTLARLK